MENEGNQSTQQQNLQRIGVAIAASVIGSLLFSGKGILAKAGMSHGESSMGMLALRMAFAAPVYAAVLFWSLRREPVPFKTLAQCAGLGLLGCYLSPTLNFYGLSTVSASLERVLVQACPAIILVFAWLKGRHAMTRFTIAALFVCYVGVALSCVGRDGGRATADPLGVSAILIGCVTWAFFVVQGVDMQRKVGTAVFTSCAMLTSALVCCVQSVATSGVGTFVHMPAGVLPIALALALLCTAAPSYLTSYGLKVLGAGRASVLTLFGPLLTPIAAAAFLGERMSAEQVGGFALVCAGGILLNRRG